MTNTSIWFYLINLIKFNFLHSLDKINLIIRNSYGGHMRIEMQKQRFAAAYIIFAPRRR